MRHYLQDKYGHCLIASRYGKKNFLWTAKTYFHGYNKKERKIKKREWRRLLTCLKIWTICLYHDDIMHDLLTYMDPLHKWLNIFCIYIGLMLLRHPHSVWITFQNCNIFTTSDIAFCNSSTTQFSLCGHYGTCHFFLAKKMLQLSAEMTIIYNESDACDLLKNFMTPGNYAMLTQIMWYNL